MQTSSEITIIGGGPAGSTAASILAKRGFEVTLFEKEVFPRQHVGETLLPFCYHIFEELGVLETMKQRFSRKPGARFLNQDASTYSNYCFNHVIKGPEYLSFHVRRDQFDKILLDNAGELGVEVREGVKVKNVELQKEKIEIKATSNNTEIQHTTQFVIDASGQSTFLGNKFKTKQKYSNLERTAFSAHWEGVQLDEQLQNGSLQIIVLKGEAKGWIWVIPFKDNRVSIGIVADSNYIRKKKEHYGASENWKEAFYLDHITGSSYIDGLLNNAQRATPVYVNGDYSYYLEKKYDQQYAIVGDASGFIDPIFASGIYLSINSAKLVGEAIEKDSSGAVIVHRLPEVYQKIDGAYQLVKEMILNYYNPEIPSFYEMTGIFQKQDSAYSLLHYLLAGDFFNRYETYQTFLNSLKNPDTFAKYKNLVYKRAILENPLCYNDKMEINE